MINQEIITIQGKMFQVKRKFPEKRINLNVEDGVKILKQYYHCDTMFKAQGLLWLCNEIKDTEYEEL
jgi:ribosomal protein L6P/L9E